MRFPSRLVFAVVVCASLFVVSSIEVVASSYSSSCTGGDDGSSDHLHQHHDDHHHHIQQDDSGHEQHTEESEQLHRDGGATTVSIHQGGPSSSLVAQWLHGVAISGVWETLLDNNMLKSISESFMINVVDVRQGLVFEALLASGMTSLLPALIVLVLPSQRDLSVTTVTTPWSATTMLYRFMLAGGAGGLIGDVVFHTLPTLVEQSGLTGHQHHHVHEVIHEKGAETGSSHHHHHHHQEENMPPTILDTIIEVLRVEISTLTPLHAFVAGIVLFYLIDCALLGLHGGGGHSHGGGGCDHHHDEKSSSSSSSAVVLGMVGDVLHNFCDGLVIGAAFLSSASAAVLLSAEEGGGGGILGVAAGGGGGIISSPPSSSARQGWKTAVLIMVHEVPHECGDFALLLQAGWSRFSALGLQMVTALGSISGVLIVYFADPSTAIMSNVLVPVASGSFIYLAVSSMMGELKRTRQLGGFAPGLVCGAGEVCSFMFGAQVMWWVLAVEELSGTHTHHHH